MTSGGRDRVPKPAPHSAWGALALALVLAGAGCVHSRGGEAKPLPAVRVSDAAGAGDAARRASVQLVIDGLDADADGIGDAGLSSYERAIQVDPTNPYAFLALARHHALGTTPESALPYLDQAAALFEAEGLRSPRVDAHLEGIRGEALFGAGDVEAGSRHLERARELAPDAWSDAHLNAEELR